MIVLHDDGSESTERSKKHFITAWKSAQPIQDTLTLCIRAWGKFTFELTVMSSTTKEFITILESGFSCGYPGTAPNGSSWALRQMNLYSDELDRAIRTSRCILINKTIGMNELKVEVIT